MDKSKIWLAKMAMGNKRRKLERLNREHKQTLREIKELEAQIAEAEGKSAAEVRKDCDNRRGKKDGNE